MSCNCKTMWNILKLMIALYSASSLCMTNESAMYVLHLNRHMESTQTITQNTDTNLKMYRLSETPEEDACVFSCMLNFDCRAVSYNRSVFYSSIGDKYLL